MTVAMEETRLDGSELAADRVRPVPEVVEITDVAARALDVIQGEDLPYLPVVARDTGKLVGVVMRKGLERGCRPMGHDPQRCPVPTHLKTGVEFWFEDQELDGNVLELANREPVVVVDRDLKPLAIVEARREA